MSLSDKNKVGALGISSLVLMPVGRSDNGPVDIAALIPYFSIEESITAGSISGSFSVIDNIGLLEDYPLRGEERAQLEVVDSLDKTRIYDLFIYRIDEIHATDQNDGLSYNLNFVSWQYFNAAKQNVLRPFKEKTVSELINEYFNEYYTTRRQTRPSDDRVNPNELVTDGENKAIIIENTDGVIRGTIPNLTAPQAMDFLTKRAFSAERTSSSFRFFENSDSFYFVSDEQLLETGRQRNQVYKLTHTTFPRSPDYFQKHMNNLDDLVNIKRYDTFEDMYDGLYKNRVIQLDIMQRILTNFNYDYTQARDNYFKDIGINNKVIDRHTDEFINENFDAENAKQFMIIKDYMDEEDIAEAQLPGNRFYPNIISNRHAYRKHLNSITIEATGPARLDICAGNIIELEIEDFDAETQKAEENKQLSGIYIVKDLIRVKDGDDAKNNYVLVKRDWSETSNQLQDRFFDGLGEGLLA